MKSRARPARVGRFLLMQESGTMDQLLEYTKVFEDLKSPESNEIVKKIKKR